MEIDHPLGVEEWAFVQYALGNEASDNLQFDSDRSQQLATGNQFVKIIVKKRLTKQLKCGKPINTETAALIFKLENENLQLHKIWKNQVAKRLDLEKKLERLDWAHSKQLKECKRLRTICLQEAVILIENYRKGCKQVRNSSTSVAEQVKEVETMEQWFMSAFKNGQKRSLETEKGEIPQMKATKRRKKASAKTEMQGLINEPRMRIMVEKATNMQEDINSSLFWLPHENAPELGNDVWPNLPEEFGPLDADLMVVELATNFDWHVERPLTG